MKDKPCQLLERARRVHGMMGESPEGAMWGYFVIKRQNRYLHIISAGLDGFGWEHISLCAEPIHGSRKHSRLGGLVTPTWDDMCVAKSLFWKDTETVVQFHPDETVKKNLHPHVLHLWKRQDSEHELPPSITV